MKLQCELGLQQPISWRKCHLACPAMGKMAYGHRAMLTGANLWASTLRGAYLFETDPARAGLSGADLTGVLRSNADLVLVKASGGLPGSA
jgi:hypothetical protein